MSVWYEVKEGFPRWEEQEGRRVYVRAFNADPGTGLASATERGLTRGTGMVYNGGWYIIRRRVLRQMQGLEQLECHYEASDTENPPRDGIYRQAGDEEWTFEGSTQEVPVDQFVRSDGVHFTQAMADNYSITDPVLLMPRGLLVWKKWLAPAYTIAGSSAAENRRSPLPVTVGAAVAMAATYLGTTGGSFETDGPRLGCVLSGQANWMCVDVQVDRDGELVLRTARFKHNPEGWSADAYPVPA